MNWSGGKLQLHSKSNANEVVRAQREHFAKIRQRIYESRENLSPIRFSFFRSELEEVDGREVVYSDTGQTEESDHSRSFNKQEPKNYRENRKYQEAIFEDGLSSRSSQPLRPRKRSQCLPESSCRTLTSVTEISSQQLAKRRVLDRTDWLGLAIAKPLQLSFNRREKRKRANQCERALIKPVMPPAEFKDQTTSLTDSQSSEIDVRTRTGSETFISHNQRSSKYFDSPLPTQTRQGGRLPAAVDSGDRSDSSCSTVHLQAIEIDDERCEMANHKVTSHLEQSDDVRQQAQNLGASPASFQVTHSKPREKDDSFKPKLSLPEDTPEPPMFLSTRNAFVVPTSPSLIPEVMDMQSPPHRENEHLVDFTARDSMHQDSEPPDPSTADHLLSYSRSESLLIRESPTGPTASMAQWSFKNTRSSSPANWQLLQPFHVPETFTDNGETLAGKPLYHVQSFDSGHEIGSKNLRSDLLFGSAIQERIGETYHRDSNPAGRCLTEKTATSTGIASSRQRSSIKAVGRGDENEDWMREIFSPDFDRIQGEFMFSLGPAMRKVTSESDSRQSLLAQEAGNLTNSSTFEEPELNTRDFQREDVWSVSAQNTFVHSEVLNRDSTIDPFQHDPWSEPNLMAPIDATDYDVHTTNSVPSAQKNFGYGHNHPKSPFSRWNTDFSIGRHTPEYGMSRQRSRPRKVDATLQQTSSQATFEPNFKRRRFSNLGSQVDQTDRRQEQALLELRSKVHESDGMISPSIKELLQTADQTACSPYFRFLQIPPSLSRNNDGVPEYKTSLPQMFTPIRRLGSQSETIRRFSQVNARAQLRSELRHSPSVLRSMPSSQFDRSGNRKTSLLRMSR